MGNVRGKQDGGIESHADALTKGKEEKDKQSESLSKEAKLKMEAVVEAEYAEADEGLKLIESQLSPFIKRDNGAELFEWYKIDFQKDIRGIYARAVEPIKEEVREESRTDLNEKLTKERQSQMGLPQQIAKRAPRKTTHQLAAEAAKKAQEVTGLLKGWVAATIKAYEKEGKDKGKITLEVYQALVRGLPAFQETVLENGKEKDMFKKLLWPTDPLAAERLNEDDYKKLVMDLTGSEIRTKNRGSLEASKEGMMIGMMNEREKMHLARVFMKERPKDAKDFVDSLVATCNLTIQQGEALYKEGDLGKMDRKKMQTCQKKFKEMIRKNNARLQSSGYYNVAAEQFTLKNVGLVIGGVWGASTVVLNSIVHLMGKDKDIAGLLTNPYIYMGIGAMGLMGTQLSGKGVQALLESPGTEAKTAERASEEEKALMEIFGRYPEIEEYFVEKDGARHFFEIEAKRREAKAKESEIKGEPKKTFENEDDLYQALLNDPNAQRKGALQGIVSAYKEDGKEQIFKTAYLIGQMSIKGQENLDSKAANFKNLITKYRKKHGLA